MTFDACRLETAVEGCGTKEGGSSECCGAGGTLDLLHCLVAWASKTPFEVKTAESIFVEITEHFSNFKGVST